MVPLLQETLVNPHATLITLFMNAVDENTTDQERFANMAPHSLSSNRLRKYLPLKTAPTSEWDPELIKWGYVRDSLGPHDHIFDR